MYLLIIKSEKRIYEKLVRKINMLELLPGLCLTWSPREKITKTVEAIKRELIKEWEEKGVGPPLEIAVIELTETQYKSIRQLAKYVVETTAESLLNEMDRFQERIKSRKGQNLSGWFRDLANRYKKLVDTTFVLDIHPTILDKLKEKWRELTLEVGRVK